MPENERVINRDTGEKGWQKTFSRGSQRVDSFIEGDLRSKDVYSTFRDGKTFDLAGNKVLPDHGWAKR